MAQVMLGPATLHPDSRAMQCTSCRLDSNNLRAYRNAHDLGAGPVVHLCAACRVLNALHPRYVAIVADSTAAAAVRRTWRGVEGERLAARR